MGYTASGIALAALGLLSAGMAAVLVQLFRQQGRLLLRLDRLERRSGVDPADSVERGAVALQARGSRGLPRGTALPDFELPDLEGGLSRLSDLRGHRVLLVNWSARCGFCQQIAGGLARLLPGLEKAGVRLRLVGAGGEAAERELAREHGLAPTVLLDAGDGVEAFASLGTPSAYLLDEQGRVAGELTVGADKVLALAGQAAGKAAEEQEPRSGFGRRDLSGSRIEREGLAPGSPAPRFELPEVRGGTVSLADFRGRRVLLVLSDPHCGPCQELMPHLARFHQEREDDPAVILVERGEIEENRLQAETHGLDFPVVVQRRWDLSRRYGLFATPAAFLIDEEGTIARQVARGLDEILTLLSDETASAGEVRHVRAV